MNFITTSELEKIVNSLTNNRPVENIYGHYKIVVKKRKKNNKVDVSLSYNCNGKFLLLWKGETTTPIPEGDCIDIVADMTLEIEQLDDECDSLDDVWYDSLKESDKKEIIMQMKEFISNVTYDFCIDMTNKDDVYRMLLDYGVDKNVLKLLEVEL